MSLARRLRRLARAHLTDLRDDLLGRPDPLADEPGTEESADAIGDEPASASSRAASASDTTDVPPEVARAYRALEVPIGSDRRTVKKGYRRVMKAYHQDRFEDDPDRRDVAGEVSKRLNAAYQTVTEYLDRRASTDR